MGVTTTRAASPVESGGEATQACAFLVLGPLETSRDGVQVSLGGPKQRTVLALLLVDVGRVVSVDALIDGVWGAAPTRGARSTLQSYMSNLRSAVGDIIVREGNGYRLLAERDQVDAFRFEGEISACGSLVDTRPAEAAQRLRKALTLWRGHAYADVAVDTRRLEDEQRRLEELRLRAVALRIEAELALGGHAELVGELEVLAAEHPLRERFRELHMLALYRSARQAEALQAYQKTRLYLRDELGVDPSPTLQELERSILAQDPALAWEAEPRVETMAVLTTRVEDAAELWERHPDDMAEATAEQDLLTAAAVEDAGGRVVHRTGEGLQALFTDVSSAAAAAQAVQMALLGRTGTPRLALAVALDVGEVETHADGVMGPVLHRCARLVATGHGGQILLSAELHATLTTEAGWQAKALGEHQLNGLARPFGVFQLVCDGLPTTFPPLRLDRPPSALPAAVEGRRLRGYELRGAVGSSAVGVVHRAYQPSMGREVAIKAIRPELANQPDFVRHFEAEAHRIAQFEHPHVVALHDYWRDPDGAYLVMPWLRGGSLRTALADGPWPLEPALRLLEQVSDALGHAHRRGVAHGGVHPGNILLDDDGHAYLADFGIGTSRLATTPSPQDDLVGLGWLAFELLTGHSPPDGPLPRVSELSPGLPRAIDDVIASATGGEPEPLIEHPPEFITRLRASVEGAPSGPVSPRTVSRNPYKGLHAFDEPDASDFFGRETLVTELVEAVARHRLVAVVGPSGIGKSSVVRAGLVPALRASGDWLITDMYPGAFPFEELASALLRVAVNRPEGMVEALSADELGMRRVTERILPADTILVIDQFEELFTLTTDTEQRHRFLEGLTALASAADSRVRVVVTLRADFLDRPLRHPEFGRLLRAGLVTVTAPGEDELAEAIKRPAQRVGVGFEPGLVSRIITDVGHEPGALPLLQYVLTELFDARPSDRITTEAYERHGGVLGALGARAEEDYAALDAAGQVAARQVFLRLVNVGENASDTRRRVPRSELRRLEVDRHAIDEILERCAAHRLITHDRDPVTRTPTVEVAHEALLSRWERLRGWIDDQREDLLLHRRLAEAAAEWEEHDRDPSYLLQGGRLHQFASWADATKLALTDRERDYVTASTAAALAAERSRRRRRHAVLAGFAAAAVVAGALAIAALASATRAEQARVEATARQLASASTVALAEDPERAILLALESAYTTLDAGQTLLPETAAAIQRALQASRLEWRVEGGSAAVAASHDGSLIATDEPGRFIGLPSDQVLVRDAASGELAHTIPNEHTVAELAFSPTEALLAVGTGQHAPGEDEARSPVRLYNATTGEQVAEFAAPINHFSQGQTASQPLAFSPDGGMLAALSWHGSPAATVTVWEVSSGQQVASIDLPAARNVAFADDATMLIDEIARIGLYDALTGEESGELVHGFKDMPAAGVPVSGVSLVVDAEHGVLVLGSQFRREVQGWDLATGEQLWSVETTSFWVEDIDTASGTVAAGGNDGELSLFDVGDGSVVLELTGHTGAVWGAAFVGSDERLASVSTDGETRVWDVSVTGPPALGALAVGSDVASDILVAPNGAELAATTALEHGEFFRFDLASGTLLDPPMGHLGGWFSPVQVDRDWTTMAWVDHDLQAWIRDLDGGATSALPPCGTPRALAADGTAVLLDGVQLCGPDDAPDGAVLRTRVIDPHSGEERYDLGRRPLMTPASAFNPPGALEGGRYLAITVELVQIELHDLANGELVVSMELDGDAALNLDFDPDGRHLAIGTQSGEVWVLDVPALVGGTAVDEAVVFRLRAHTGGVPGVALNHDGLLATSSFGSLRLWDIHTGRELLDLPVDTSEPPIAAFTPDGRALYYGDQSPLGEHLVRRLPLDADELVALAEARVTRTLTHDECRRYVDPAGC